MSEYWVSKKKYFCKYCDIYIADDAPSRQQHENGLRHKGNQERFIRGLYKTGEKRKKDQEEERREMQRIERVARDAFAHDVGSGLAKADSAPVASSSISAAQKPLPKPNNPYANYSTAASLGYQDPDAERLKAETERRLMQGVAGDWEVISPPQGTLSQSETSTLESVDDEVNRKRDREAGVVEDDRSWKLRKKTLGLGLGAIYDPGIIPIKLKTKNETKEDEASGTGAVIPAAGTSDDSKATTVPKWTKTQWKRAGESVGDSITVEPDGMLGLQDAPKPSTKVDGIDECGISEPLKEPLTHVKLEETPTVPAAGGSGNMFRKRKAPGSIGNRGKRQN